MSESDERRGTSERGRGSRGFRYAQGDDEPPPQPAVDVAEPDDDDDDDAEWESWAEPEVAPTRDLFSLRMFATAADCLAYAKTEHALDLATVAKDLRLDIYGRVKLVNYVRARAAAGDQPKAIVQAVSQAAGGERASWPWVGDEYLMPVVEEDPLLYSLGAPVSGDGDAGAAEAPLDDLVPEDVEMPDGGARGGAGGVDAGGPADETALLLQTIYQMRADMIGMLGLNEDAPQTEGASTSAEAPTDAATALAALASELRRAKEMLAQRDAQVASLTEQVGSLTAQLATERAGRAGASG